MNIKTHSHIFILLALALTLLLIFAVSVSNTFAEEHDTSATDETATESVEDSDSSLRDTLCEQRDVHRDLLND